MLKQCYLSNHFQSHWFLLCTSCVISISKHDEQIPFQHCFTKHFVSINNSWKQMNFITWEWFPVASKMTMRFLKTPPPNNTHNNTYCLNVLWYFILWTIMPTNWWAIFNLYVTWLKSFLVLTIRFWLQCTS